MDSLYLIGLEMTEPTEELEGTLRKGRTTGREELFLLQILDDLFRGPFQHRAFYDFVILCYPEIVIAVT